MSPRDKILERRAMFVAAALAATTSGCEDKPQVCLSAVADEYRDAGSASPVDAGTTTADSEPQPCLSVPMPCLTVAPPSDAGTAPRVCLKIAPPPRDAGKPGGPCLSY